MEIILENIGKRYNQEWIFRGIDFSFSSGTQYAILGSNGSGKSTLLQVIAGNYLPSEGAISYILDKQKVASEKAFELVSIAAPYLDLIDEFSFEENLAFANRFKSFLYPVKEMIELSGLSKAGNKELKYFSSGMKQRARLTLAILCASPILLLDEPTMNLDKKAIEWYRELLTGHMQNKIIFVCSNQQTWEYDFCKDQILVENYKTN